MGQQNLVDDSRNLADSHIHPLFRFCPQFKIRAIDISNYLVCLFAYLPIYANHYSPNHSF